MMRRLFLAAAAGLIAAPALLSARPAPRETSRRAHEFAFTDIDGNPMPLDGFAGKPLLIVNTASRCGFTGQYDGLQAVWERFRDRGLVVIGVPSNDFRQELSSNEAVRDFCEMNFGIDFPMTAITPVTGRQAHPFYAWARDVMGGSLAPRWNFHKYLVDGSGRLVASFGTGIEPTAPKVIAAIERVLPAS